MTINEIAEWVCEEEKGKEEVSIAQVKEILRIISKELYEDPELLYEILSYGRKLYRKELRESDLL